MKKKHFKSVILIFMLAVFCTSAINIYAQVPKPCGTYKINTDELNKALQFEKANKALSAQHYLIRLYFHIVEYNDGSHAGAASSDVDNEFANMQSDYGPGNICFLKAGLNYIQNSALDTATDNGSIPSILSNYNVPGCINIYYLYYINGSNGNCNCGIGGDAFNVPNTFCIVAKGNLGVSHTSSHETGHCLGLLHTFDYSNGYEDIDGSNSATSGDQIADTHADPYAFKKQSCFSTLGSVYTGNCPDPKGQTNYDPPYTNLMAYWWTYGYINLFNTSGQFTRINSMLNVSTVLQPCESPDNITLNNVSYSSGYLMTSAVNSLSTSGSVNLNGTTIATLGSQTVYLENGFNAIPSAGGLISIEPSSCNYTFSALYAGKYSNTYIGKATDAAKLVVYPNPASSIVHLDFTTIKDENNMVVQVYNTEMKKLKEFKIGNLIKGKQNQSINLNDLTSGVYLIVLKLGSSQLTAKVVLIK